MNTFILFWNPKISSYTLERMRDDTEHWAHVGNWSVWQHDIAHKGDRFFVVRCGEGKTGICMSGHFRSEPYRDEDWSGKGREVYYMDLWADTVIDPDYLPILSTGELSKQIPSFDWSGGHSGRLLPEKDAEKLEEFWESFLEQNKQIFNKLTLQQHIYPSVFEENEKEEAYEATISITSEGDIAILDSDEEEIVKGFDIEQLKKEFTQKMEEAGVNNSIEFHFECVDDQYLFAKALEIAKDVYANMVDDGENDYFRRAIWDIRYFYDDASMVTGLLQYVFKNHKITPEWLMSQGIPKAIVDTIIVLQQKDGEDFEHYIKRVGDNTAAANILYEKLDDSLNIRNLPELTEDKFHQLAQNLKAWHYLKDKREQGMKAVFNGNVREFEAWLGLNEEADMFAICGEYNDEDLATMSGMLSKSLLDNVSVDISELNIHREASFDQLIRTYEDDIIMKLKFDEEINLLEKMMLNRKYSNVFEIEDDVVFCNDGRILVHFPIDQPFVIPDGVEIIGRCAATGNQTIETLKLPKSVRTIDDYAFGHCEKLVQVSLHDGIESIGKGCFSMCDIEKLRLSQHLSEIPDNAFEYNELEHVTIPPCVKRIGAEAFFCNYINEVVIPEGTERIEYAAFTSWLKHVTLPSTLKEIAYDFYYEEMTQDPKEMMPYVEIHPDNPIFYSKGGKLYRRDTGVQVLGNNNDNN